MKLRNIDLMNMDPGERKVDGHGLYCERSAKTGRRVWRYRYRIAGKENIFTIGAHGDGPGQFTLAQAREERRAAAAQVSAGHHPRAKRISEVAAQIMEGHNTFRVVSEEWLKQKKSHVGPAHFRKLERALHERLWPAFGDMNIREVQTPHVTAVLRQVSSKHKWALMIKQTCSMVFQYAQIEGKANHNPAVPIKASAGGAAIIKKRASKPNPWLRLDEVPAFLTAVDEAGERTEGCVARNERVLALKLLMLTLVRPGELAGAPWAEFDLDKALWLIPEKRMKMKRPHYIPLSRQALAILRELHALTGDTGYVLPERRAGKRAGHGPKAPAAFRKFIAMLPEWRGRITGHGLRATASTALNGVVREDGTRRWDRDWIELQLAHVSGGVRAAYNHADYLPQRAQMLQAWADMVLPPSRVVALPSRTRVHGQGALTRKVAA